LADRKGVLSRKAEGMILQGCVSAVTGKAYLNVASVASLP
jgi:hypothetical protein